MQITQRENKFYAKLLDDIRTQYFPWNTNKELREYIKEMNPNYPVDNTTGKYVSFAKISVEEFRRHLSFLKIMAIKYGMKSDYLNVIDRNVAGATHFKTKITKIEHSGKDFNIVSVLCSRCGSVTKRGVTRERLKELMDIDEGKAVEIIDPINKSFLCVNCTSKDIAE